MPHIVAYFGTVLRRGESTPAAAILATQWVLEVAGVWYASARTKGYLWHLPTGVVDSLVELHLANLAEGADPVAQSYLSELLDLHQSLDWAAAGLYLDRRVGGEDDGAARAFVHCEKRLVEGRSGLHEGLGDPSYPYAAGVTATSAPPESGWGAPGVVSPQQRKRTRGAAERPPARGGAVRWTARAGPSPVGPATRPTLAPPGVPYYPALGAGQNLSWGYVTPQCARALATTYPTAAGTLRVAHGEPKVASLVVTLAWDTRGAGGVLRGFPSPLSAAAEQFPVDTTPEAIRYQMASLLEGHGQRGSAGVRCNRGGRELHSSPVRRGARRSRGSLLWGRLLLLRRGSLGGGAHRLRRGVHRRGDGAESGAALDVGSGSHGSGAGPRVPIRPVRM